MAVSRKLSLRMTDLDQYACGLKDEKLRAFLNIETSGGSGVIKTTASVCYRGKGIVTCAIGADFYAIVAKEEKRATQKNIDSLHDFSMTADTIELITNAMNRHYENKS